MEYSKKILSVLSVLSVFLRAGVGGIGLIRMGVDDEWMLWL